MKDSLDIEILSKTFDDLPIGIGIFHIDDLEDMKSIRYVFMNKVVLYEMRKNKEEVIGKKIIEVAPEAYEHEGGLFVINTYLKIAKEGGSINLGLVEYSNHIVAGTYECSVHHIKDNYVYVMLRNVTELEQTKNKLEQINKELSQFTYMVSHDLKEPLRTVTNYINLIKEGYKEQLDEHAGMLIGFISSAATRMTKLIVDILDLSSIGKSKEMTIIDCEQLIKNLQQDLAIKIKETDTSFVIGKLPKVKGSETELRLLFQNLITNAMKFTKPGVKPIIKISAEEQDGWTFSIQDNGIGIEEKNMEKIFNAFHRLHDNSEYEGSGIGLAHCRKIIDLHKGKIRVSSTPGEGSTFYFNIPN